MLSKKSYQILRYIYKNPDIPQPVLQNHFGKSVEDSMDFLFAVESLKSDKLIFVGSGAHDGKSTAIYRLTPKGEGAYLEQMFLVRKGRSEWIRYSLTTLIAVASFVKSFFF